MNNLLNCFYDNESEVIAMLDMDKMIEVSELLYDNGIRLDVSISPNVVKVPSWHLEYAQSLLKDYAVEVVVNEGAIPIAPRVEKEEVNEVSVGFHDLLEIIKWW